MHAFGDVQQCFAFDGYIILPPDFASNALVATPAALFNFSQQNAILYFRNQGGGPYICFENTGSNCDDHIANHFRSWLQKIRANCNCWRRLGAVREKRSPTLISTGWAGHAQFSDGEPRGRQGTALVSHA
jgi:hypothetical protein